MKRTILCIALIAIIVSGCKKDDVPPHEEMKVPKSATITKILFYNYPMSQNGQNWDALDIFSPGPDLYFIFNVTAGGEQFIFNNVFENADGKPKGFITDYSIPFSKFNNTIQLTLMDKDNFGEDELMGLLEFKLKQNGYLETGWIETVQSSTMKADISIQWNF